MDPQGEAVLAATGSPRLELLDSGQADHTGPVRGIASLGRNAFRFEARYDTTRDVSKAWRSGCVLAGRTGTHVDLNDNALGAHFIIYSFRAGLVSTSNCTADSLYGPTRKVRTWND